MNVQMSEEMLHKRMNVIENWMSEIDSGELYLDTEEYEDYSGGYWDSEWITDYYDNQEIGNKIAEIIRFAKECVDNGWYQEAMRLYKWLWEMLVSAEEEWADPIDLEQLVEEKILCTDLEKLALLTLYATYQVKKPEERAESIYMYFSIYSFKKVHIEDMLCLGRENLPDMELFWSDWIALLKSKKGDAEGRRLKEAVLYIGDLESLGKMADENYEVHPSLYLETMAEYEKIHDYMKVEETGKRAVQNIDCHLKIRSKIAWKAASAAFILGHTDSAMMFCWECFRSDSTVRNLLRLFATKEVAGRYGVRVKEVLHSRIKGNPVGDVRNTELEQNIMGDANYYTLSFYSGDFTRVRKVSKNPEGSLGWSFSFIETGIRLFLLYLFEGTLPTKASDVISRNIGFGDREVQENTVGFEQDIIDESARHKLSVFWNYFQRWKQYFPMEQQEREQYLEWIEEIVYSRADAIVGGQHRGHYGEVAVLLAMIGDVKEQMGKVGAKRDIFAMYKKKFPRHSSFQAEMKRYFEV